MEPALNLEDEMSDKTLTTRQVSDELGVSMDAVQRWVREGRLNPHTEGKGRQRRIRWTAEDLEAARELHRAQCSQMSRQAYDAFGWAEPLLTQAQIRADFAESQEQMVLLSMTRGICVMHNSASLAEVRQRCGEGPLLIIPPSPAEQV